jgi:hypothetical protein
MKDEKINHKLFYSCPDQLGSKGQNDHSQSNKKYYIRREREREMFYIALRNIMNCKISA